MLLPAASLPTLPSSVGRRILAHVSTYGRRCLHDADSTKEAQDAAAVCISMLHVPRGCIPQIRKTLQTSAKDPSSVVMPRVAARQLLALAAAARSPTVSHAQPAASLWSSAFSPTGCSQSCTCSRCVTSGRRHGLSCGCSSCRTRTAVLGMPTVPSGRMHLATLGDSQDKVACTLLSPITGMHTSRSVGLTLMPMMQTCYIFADGCNQ